MKKPGDAPSRKPSPRPSPEVAGEGEAGRFLLEAGLLAVIVLAAAGLRIYQLDARGFWLDEFWIAELTTGRGSAHLNLPLNEPLSPPPNLTSLSGAEPWHRVWTTMDQVTHPPLYFMTLRLWRETVAGDDDFLLRTYSVLASLLAIVTLYLAVRTVHPMPVALWSAGLMSAAWPQIKLAQEARSYAMLMALGMFALLCMMQLKSGRRSWLWAALLGAGTLAMMLTHYFAAGGALALGVLALFWLGGAARWRAIITLTAAAVAFAVLWGPSMWAHRAMFATDDPSTVFLRDEAPDYIVRAMVNLLSAPAEFIDALLPRAMRALLGATLLVAPLTLLIRRRRLDLLPWYVWMCGVLLVLAALDLMRATLHLTHVRYTLLAAPGAYVLLAAMAWPAQRGWARYVVPAAVLLIALVGLPRFYTQWQPDAQRLAYDMNRHIPPGEPIVYVAPAEKQWQAGAMYLQTSHYFQPFRWPAVILDRPVEGELREQLRRYPRVWVIDGWDEAPVEQLVPGYRPEAQITYGGIGRLVRMVRE